jgi:hypothetical protein
LIIFIDLEHLFVEQFDEIGDEGISEGGEYIGDLEEMLLI